MKIPFDIKYRPQIESGEYKVKTKDGKSVRIICWDKKSQKKYGYHIVGLIEFGPQHEESTYYTIDGKGRLKDKEPELFIVTPEEELTEFEQEVSDIVEYCKEHGEHVAFDYAKRHAQTLLALAKKELLKDLPRWEPNQVSYSEEPVLCNGNTILNLGWVHIHIDQLKKLPGFKEDEK